MNKPDSGRIQCNHVDVRQRRICFAGIDWQHGRLATITVLGEEKPDHSYLINGFIDAHVHVESSMLTPVEFSRLATRHGTIACLSDPHEIANVLGLQGIRFMLENAAQTPLRFFFGAPSCVPATPFETAGARLDAEQLEVLFKSGEAGYLSEMMNYPGVLAQDPAVMNKLALTRRYHLPVDGHAPGLLGEQARRYAASGITTDHECSSLEEAETKLEAGMQILIREGSAARNFEVLHPLVSRYPEQVMFCSDDKHPDDLQQGHIDRLAARAVAMGHDVFDVLRCACLNPIEHYRLPLGSLQPGDSMDGVLIDDLQRFKVLQTWIKGACVAENGRSLIESVDTTSCNCFQARPVAVEDFILPAETRQIRVIEALDGELFTRAIQTRGSVQDGHFVPDPRRDILLLSVVNRYHPAPPTLAFIRGFGLEAEAIASTVAHDSHNQIAVGADVEALCQAINSLIDCQGGIAVVDASQEAHILPLPVAGLMSLDDADSVAQAYKMLDDRAKRLGSKLRAPFMTLSFMALLVIPELKLSDRGLFDGRSFTFTSITV